MSAKKIEIKNLRLRASGLTPAEARHLGEIVAKRLAETPLTGTEPRSIPALTVRVSSRRSDSPDRLAGAIADKVRSHIR